MRRRRTLLALFATALVSTVALTAAASAHRAPTRHEAAAISRALHRSPETSGVSCFHVRHIVISTAGPWAKATLVPCNPQAADKALSILRRRSHHWRVRDLGTSGVGCSVAPKPVRRDLRLFCP